MTDEPRRKHHRLPTDHYLGRQSYFITVCTHEKYRAFENSLLTAALAELLRKECTRHGFGLYAYCAMPDHVHFVAVGLHDSCNLQSLVRGFKGAATPIARRFGIRSLWQKGFYDHVIRSGEAGESIAAYIFMNPVRAGLVRDWKEWPFSGSNMLEWKGVPSISNDFKPPWKV